MKLQYFGSEFWDSFARFPLLLENLKIREFVIFDKNPKNGMKGRKQGSPETFYLLCKSWNNAAPPLVAEIGRKVEFYSGIL